MISSQVFRPIVHCLRCSTVSTARSVPTSTLVIDFAMLTTHINVSLNGVSITRLHLQAPTLTLPNRPTPIPQRNLLRRIPIHLLLERRARSIRHVPATILQEVVLVRAFLRCLAAFSADGGAKVGFEVEAFGEACRGRGRSWRRRVRGRCRGRFSLR